MKHFKLTLLALLFAFASFAQGPPAISGTLTVCVGASTPLSDVGGGTWQSTALSIATIGSASGIAYGVSAGTTIISYTVGGNLVTAVLTVNPNPGPITGITSVCEGLTTSLMDNMPAGGMFSSSDFTRATVGMSSGLVTTGANPGPVTITYTLATGCYTFTMVNVVAPPTLYTVTGGGGVCTGGAGVLVGLSGSESGVSYQLELGSSPAPGTAPVTGMGVPFNFSPPQTTTGTYTVIATNAALCQSTMTGNVAVTPNPLPTVFIVTGGGGICPGGAGVSIGLSGSQNGVTYQLQPGTSSITGTGMGVPPPFSPPPTTPGTYTVIATNTATGCQRAMVGSATITSSPLPVISGTFIVCGTSTTTLGLSAGVAGGTWSSSNMAFVYAISGTGEIIGVAPGTSMITYTAPGSGCTATQVVTDNPVPVISGTFTLCGTSTTTLGLSAGVAGGTWSSSSAFVTVDVNTGVIMGVAPGTSTITYVAPGAGCTATQVVTDNPVPVIEGTFTLCGTSTTTLGLSAGVAGGTWSSSSAFVTIDVNTGVMIGVTPGTSTITYVTPGAGCTATQVVTDNPAPTMYPVANVDYCNGAPEAGFTFGPVSGTTFSWTSSANAGFGTGGSGSIPAFTATAGATVPTVAPITVTPTAGGCTGTPVTFTVTVDEPPAPITGGDVKLCANSTISLGESVGGGMWSVTPASTSLVSFNPTATGCDITGIATATGVATIQYTLVNACGSNTVSTKVTVNPSPTITGNMPFCANSNIYLYGPATPAHSWNSGNTIVATVAAATGAEKITGVIPGGHNNHYL